MIFKIVFNHLEEFVIEDQNNTTIATGSETWQVLNYIFNLYLLVLLINVCNQYFFVVQA